MFGLHFKKNGDGKLSFRDYLVKKVDSKFLTFLYRKTTFSRQCTRWNAYDPPNRMINFIKTQVHRAMSICSKLTLQQLETIKAILRKKGYSDNVVEPSVFRKECFFHFGLLESLGLTSKLTQFCTGIVAEQSKHC